MPNLCGVEGVAEEDMESPLRQGLPPVPVGVSERVCLDRLSTGSAHPYRRGKWELSRSGNGGVGTTCLVEELDLGPMNSRPAIPTSSTKRQNKLLG